MMIEKISDIEGLKLFILDKHMDDRGSFLESFNYKEIPISFVQDNQSISMRGVIRGLHLQIKPFDQIKLIRVIKGKILDVVVDLRPESKTYMQNFSIELSGDNGKMLFIPSGCLHGFLSLEDNTIVSYKVDKYWNKASEQGIRWDDPQLKLNWKLNEYNIDQPIVSSKDKQLPYFNKVTTIK